MPDPTLTQLATGNSTTATTTAAFAAQTAGTLLVLIYTGDDYTVTSGSGRPESTGWTKGPEAQFSAGLCLWYKVAAGSETSVQYTIGSALKSVWAVLVATDIDTSAPFDVSGTQFTNSNSTSYTSPAVTPAVGRPLTIAAISAPRFSGTGITSHTSWLNSYTEITDINTGGTGTTESLGVAYLVSNGGSSTSTGSTFNGTAIGAGGIIAAFKNATGGGSNAGTLSASIPKVTAALTGQSVNAGSLAAAIPKVTGALTGQSVNAGGLAASTPKVTAALAGQSVNAGSLAAVTPKVTATVTGQSVNTGSLTASTPNVTGAVSGQSVNAGTMSATVPRVTTNIADVATNVGTFAVTVPKVTAAVSGASVNAGALAGSLPLVTASITGAATNTGTLSAVIPKVTAAIADTTTLAGTLTVTVPKITALINGASVNTGTMTVSVPRVTAGITGQLVNAGTLDATTPLVVCTLTADQVLTGSLAAVLPLLRFRATTAIDRDITVTGMLEPRRYSAGITARTKSGTIYRRWGGTLNE